MGTFSRQGTSIDFDICKLEADCIYVLMYIAYLLPTVLKTQTGQMKKLLNGQLENTRSLLNTNTDKIHKLDKDILETKSVLSELSPLYHIASARVWQ